MHRRVVLAGALGLGGALAASCALPFSSRRTARVGILAVPGRAEVEAGVNAFLQRSAELGWRNGDNLVFEERWGNGQRDVIPALAAELVNLPVDVLVASGTAPIQAAQAATRTIPIVMTGAASDPVANGFVTSLARPGGNITGLGNVQPVLSAKRVEILAEVVPGLRRLAILVTPDNPSKAQNVANLQAAADRLGIEMRVADMVLDDIPRAFVGIREWPAQALHLIGDAAMQQYRPSILAQIDQLGVPTIHSTPGWVDAGGLMAYGEDTAEALGRAADFVDKILRGANPAEIPVELPSRFPFVVNQRALEALNLQLPRTVAEQVTRWVYPSAGSLVSAPEEFRKPAQGATRSEIADPDSES